MERDIGWVTVKNSVGVFPEQGWVVPLVDVGRMVKAHSAAAAITSTAATIV